MLKTVFEKWEDIKDKFPKDTSYVAPYYMGSVFARIYFGMFDNKNTIFIEFKKDVISSITLKQIKGMKMEIVDAPYISENMKYIMVQNEMDNEEIFYAFSSSLVDELMDCDNYYSIYDTFIKVVKEYKDYFSNPNFQLSKMEEQGLCAELLELKKMIDFKGEKCLKNWIGPSKNKRDFVFNTTALEVKSTISQMDTTITISNENQLNSNVPDGLDALFLKVYVFDEVDVGINILSCIKDIEDTLDDVELKRLFRRNLLKLKVDSNVYQTDYNFALQYVKIFKIDDNFPKLTKDSLPPEIHHVKYKISINGLKEYETNEGDFYGQLQ